VLDIPLIVLLSLDSLILQPSDIQFVEKPEETLNYLVSQMRKNANSRSPLLSSRKRKKMMREKTLFKALTASLIRVRLVLVIDDLNQHGRLNKLNSHNLYIEIYLKDASEDNQEEEAPITLRL
jgi:hypothetical protein